MSVIMAFLEIFISFVLRLFLGRCLFFKVIYFFEKTKELQTEESHYVSSKSI